MIQFIMYTVGVLYVVIGILYFLKGNWGNGLAFICYSLANIGLYFGAK